MAREEVAIPSGVTYDAVKIEYHEAATPLINNQRVEATIVEWFAPRANRYIKRVVEAKQGGKIIESTSEILTDYVRHGIE